MKYKFLPIGSIVILKNTSQRLMIIGYLMSDKLNNEYDYCGCIYPIGVQNKNDMYYFNNNDISLILDFGFIDEETKELLKLIYEKKME